MIVAMAYDEELARRIHDLLDGEEHVTSRQMFGGLGFMVDGHMAVAAASKGSLMVRVDPSASADLVLEDGVEVMEMQEGRPVPGWLLVSPEVLGTDEALRRWVELGLTHVRALPPKA